MQATALAVAATAAGAETTGADLVGRWETAIGEQAAPDGSASAWVRQAVEFTAERKTLVTEAFTDEGATVPLFTYASTGPWRAVGPAEATPGALALVNDRSEITIHVDAPGLRAAIGVGA